MTGLILAVIALPVTEVSEQPDFARSTYPGRVTAIAQVDVRPQVSGEILDVAFENGQMVKEGDVLYRLDPVKYESAVKNAEARVVEMRANVSYAETSYERHKRLLETRAVSLDAVDNALSQRDSSRASYAAAKAALVSAQDDLKHCTIVAPISGKIGTTAKTRGNYVTAAGSTLVSIVQFDPIRVKFPVSNRELLDIKGRAEKLDTSGVDLSLRLANGELFETPGVIEYAENQADELTDTLTLYARFDNPAGRLVPGGTVAVTISSKAGVPRPAIPPTAVMQDTQGPYVWVLDSEGRAERRAIARGNQAGEFLFVEKGLKVGERVVADGAHRIKRGDIVKAAE